MFLVDKYQKDSNYITCHQDIIEKLLDTFDSHQKIYKKSLLLRQAELKLTRSAGALGAFETA